MLFRICLNRNTNINKIAQTSIASVFQTKITCIDNLIIEQFAATRREHTRMTEASDFKAFSQNEQFGSLRNRMEDHQLIRLFKRFDSDYKHSFLNIDRSKHDVQCSIQKINDSTGHYKIKPIIEILPNFMLIGKTFRSFLFLVKLFSF